MKRIPLKNYISDAGLAFMVGNILVFSGVGTAPVVICAGASAAIVGVKTLAHQDFKETETTRESFKKAMKIIKDGRTPLFLSSAALLGVGALALTGGAILPAVASFGFMAGNFAMAQSIHKKKPEEAEETQNKTKKAQNKTLSFLSKGLKASKELLKRPDLYLAAGLGAVVLMSGGVGSLAGALMVPFIAAGTVIGIANAAGHKPEHKGHPKLYLTAACIGSAIAAGLGAAPAIAIANVIFAATYTNIEAQVTPGGLKQIIKDIKSVPKSISKALLGRRPSAPSISEPNLSMPMQVQNASSQLEPGQKVKVFNTAAPKAISPGAQNPAPQKKVNPKTK